MAGGASASPGSWGSAARALCPPGQGQGPAEGSPLARFSSGSTADKELSVSPSPPLPACLTRHFKDFPTKGLQHPAKASQHWGADFKDGLELGASPPVERPYHFRGDSPQEGPAQCRGEGRPLLRKAPFSSLPSPSQPPGQPHPPFRWVGEDAGEIEPGEVTRLPACVPRFMDVRTWRSGWGSGGLPAHWVCTRTQSAAPKAGPMSQHPGKALKDGGFRPQPPLAYRTGLASFHQMQSPPQTRGRQNATHPVPDVPVLASGGLHGGGDPSPVSLIDLLSGGHTPEDPRTNLRLGLASLL